jgi:hypothetical protein
MVIRSQQMDRLAVTAGEDFFARADKHIQRCFPGTWSTQDRGTRIRLAVERGQAYGLRSEWAVMRYVDLTAAIGTGFERMPEYATIAEVLVDPALNERSKISRVYAMVNEIDPALNRERPG